MIRRVRAVLQRLHTIAAGFGQRDIQFAALPCYSIDAEKTRRRSAK